jgi:hypothetical protein
MCSSIHAQLLYIALTPTIYTSLLCRLLRRADVVDAGDVSDAANRHLDIFYTGESTVRN